MQNPDLTKNFQPKIAFFNRRLELQIGKLNQAIDRFTQRDKAIFARIVDVQAKHDQARANVFTNELQEIRKMIKTIIKAKLSLEKAKEQLSKGLNPFEMAGAVALINATRQDLTPIFPEAENELGEISNQLSGVMIEAAFKIKDFVDFEDIANTLKTNLETITEEADKQLKDKYPETPVATPEENTGNHHHEE